MRKDMEFPLGALQSFLSFPRPIPRGCWILLMLSTSPAIGSGLGLTPAAPPTAGCTFVWTLTPPSPNAIFPKP